MLPPSLYDIQYNVGNSTGTAKALLVTLGIGNFLAIAYNRAYILSSAVLHTLLNTVRACFMGIDKPEAQTMGVLGQILYFTQEHRMHGDLHQETVGVNVILKSEIGSVRAL